MPERVQSCAVCVHSRWCLTPTGRIKKHESGRCMAVFVEPVLPACIVRPHYQRSGIWPDDGSDCPLFQLNSGKPKAEGE